MAIGHFAQKDQVIAGLDHLAIPLHDQRLRHGRPVSGVAFSPDGESLVSGGGGRLRGWDAATGRLRRTIALEGPGELAFACTTDGFVVANAPQVTTLLTVQALDAGGKAIGRAEIRRRGPVQLALSPDGKRLALSQGNVVWLHDTAAGRESVRIPVREVRAEAVAVPSSAHAGAGGPTRTTQQAAAPRHRSSLNWAALARCESGGDPRLVDGPYYGLYQFTIGTWRSVGGRGLPSNASPAEQTHRA